MTILRVLASLALALFCTGCGLGANSSPETKIENAITSTPSPSKVKSNWTVETKTDDFGDATTQVKTFVTNSKGEFYGLYLSCDHTNSALNAGVVGNDADGYALTWAKYDAEVKLDGGKVQTWKNSAFVEGMLSFEMSAKSLIRILERHKTLSIKHLPSFLGGREGIHIMTFDISDLSSHLPKLEEAGCSI
jgi:hypothetical protein